jgi:hypothetical protein
MGTFVHTHGPPPVDALVVAPLVLLVTPVLVLPVLASVDEPAPPAPPAPPSTKW